jgi:hypothetical protein
LPLLTFATAYDAEGMYDGSSKPTGKVGNRSTSRAKGPRDPNELAFSIIQHVTAQAPKQEPPSGKNPAAVTLGHLDGPKGGKARAKEIVLSGEQGDCKKGSGNRWKTSRS